jgi:hypothetical protein
MMSCLASQLPVLASPIWQKISYLIHRLFSSFWKFWNTIYVLARQNSIAPEYNHTTISMNAVGRDTKFLLFNMIMTDMGKQSLMT